MGSRVTTICDGCGREQTREFREGTGWDDDSDRFSLLTLVVLGVGEEEDKEDGFEADLCSDCAPKVRQAVEQRLAELKHG